MYVNKFVKKGRGVKRLKNNRVNQTIFVDNLKKRMKDSFEQGFYLESIVCSYAIIENRTKRICEHLGENANNLTLNKKTETIYEKIKERDLETDRELYKLTGYLKFRISKTNIIVINQNTNYRDIINDLENYQENSKLVTFRIQRNEIIHNLYKYDSSNPQVTDFNKFRELAEDGIYVADNLCTIASGMKRKIKQLGKKNNLK